MFAIPFGRIFWKEYRTNRALWLVCLLIGVLIQFISWVTLRHTREQSFLADGLFAQAVFIPVMYAIGCGAVMFASEREDGTCNWLLALSAPPLPTLLGKSTFAIISTVILQIMMVICSILFLAGSEPDSWCLFWVPFGLVALIWSCLGSLVSRRVLTSAFTAAFWMVLTTFISFTIAESLLYTLHSAGRLDHYHRLWIVAWMTPGLIAFVANGWLGWRWCHGDYLDGSVFENFLSEINAVSNLLLPETAKPRRLPLRVEYDQTWRRTWQRLIWQERKRSQLPIVLLPIACVVSMATVPIIIGESSEVIGLLWVCLLVICCVASVAMGWLAFQVDSSLQEPRFLLNRGVSHSLLWVAKQSVWLPRAMFVPLAICIVVVICICSASTPQREYMIGGILAKSSLTGPHEEHGYVWVARAIWFILLSYSCGQLASLLFRRTVIAIAASAFFLFVLGVWWWFVELCHLPLGWTMGLPFLATLLITLWQVRPWLLEDQSWIRRGKTVASLIAIPLVLVTLLCSMRVGQVFFAKRVDSSFVAEFSRQMQDRSKWESDSTISKSVLDRITQLSRASHDDVAMAAAELLDLINQNPITPMWGNLGYSELGPLRGILEQRTAQLMDEGRLVESLEYDLGRLKLASSVAAQSGMNYWYGGAIYQSMTLEDLVIWANHPKQTVNSLREAITQIEHELASYPSFSSSVVKSYVQDRNWWTLPSQTELFERLMGPDTTLRYASPFPIWFLCLPSERLRFSLLLTRLAELNFASAILVENELIQPERTNFRSGVKTNDSITRAEFQTLVATTPLVTQFDAEGGGTSIKDRQTRLRAGLIRLNLIAYRLEHGNLPDDLAELLPAIKAVYLIDPWSGRMFEYHPTFLFTPGQEGHMLVPVNSEELKPVSPLGGEITLSPGMRIRIPLKRSLNEDSDPESELQRYRAGYHTLFSIPAPSKSSEE